MDRSVPPRFGHEESVAAVRAFFDRLADAEWDRLASDVAGRVSSHVHGHFLEQFVFPGMRVLEIGAGPGRFTIALARIGARITVTDISPVQLSLNARHVGDALAETAVEARHLLDVCDVSSFADGEFDAVVAFGGPLSYAFERAEEALVGLLRITRKGGPIVASVMSTLGSYRHLLGSVVEIGEEFGEDANDRILATGDLREIQPPGSGQHLCRMFRFRDVQALVAGAGGSLIGASASNWASLGDKAVLERIAADPSRWARFLDREAELCSEPGAVDGGTHLLFAAEARQQPSAAV